MEESFVPPNILYLDGITMKDYESMEDIFHKQLMERCHNEPDPNPRNEQYDAIPKVFTCLNTWPKKTNLKCWMCDFIFDDPPKFIPTYIKNIADDKIEVGVLGNMCSFACTNKYISTNFHRKDQAWKLLDNLVILYKLFTGKSVYYIPEAPCKTTMRQYGGSDSETDFRKKLKAVEQSIDSKLLMR